MIISEVNAVCELLEKAGNFASLLKDGWYKSSAELATFSYRVENLTLKHKEWISVLRKFGRSDDEVLTAFVAEADKILSEEEKHVSKLKKSKFARWKQRAFPGRLTDILDAMEMRVNSGLQSLKSRDEMFGLLEGDENRTEIPLPFQRDHKYVPVVQSVAEVRTAIESGEGSRVVIVHGDGGLGKTSLVKYMALYYHNKRHERTQAGESASLLFSDGVFFIRCGKGASTRITELQQELLESLGCAPETPTANFHEGLEGEHQKLRSPHYRSLRFKLARRKALIIYDDVWEREVLEGLLIPGEAVTYLITSRRRDVWPDRDARRILLQRPTIEEGQKILAMYTELPKNTEGAVDSIISGVGCHPLMLANIGLAMSATGGNSPDEWRRMAKGWQDELRQRDFNYQPILHGQSYALSIDDTVNLMMESLEEGERSLLLLMSLLENERLPEEVVKFFRKYMEPEETYFDYRRYRSQLEDKSLLEVYSTDVQDSGSFSPDGEYTQTCLAIHTIRALSIRKYHSDQIRAMAKRALQPANHTNSYSINSWMIGRGLRGAITATSDLVRSLVTWGAGPVSSQTFESIIGATGRCGKEKNSAHGVLTGIMAAMYFDRTLLGVTEVNAPSLLQAANRDCSITFRSVQGHVNLLDLVQTARGRKSSVQKLVRFLNPDGEEEWRQEAHYCASKIILRFICRHELDDVSVARLVQLQPHTTVVMCDTLLDILENGYWAPQFVDHNTTFSSVHSETTKTLFDLFYNDTTSTSILRSVLNALVGARGEFRVGGILSYEDEDTIVKVVMKVLPKIASASWQGAIISELNHFDPTRITVVIGKIPDLRKRIVRLLFDGNQLITDGALKRIATLSCIKSFAVEIIATPGASDMLWAQIGSSANKGRLSVDREWYAVLILINLTGLSGVDKNRIVPNQTNLINLLDILTSNQDGRDLGKRLTSSNEKYPPDSVWNGREVDDVTKIVDLLGNLAVTTEVRKMICNLCPKLPERLHILERYFIEHAATSTDLAYIGWAVGCADELVLHVSKARTIFDLTLVNSGTVAYNPPRSPKACAYGLVGRFLGCMAMEMYKEALDVECDLHPDMSKDLKCWWFVRWEIIFAKTMLKDYTGALVIVNDQFSEFKHQSFDRGVAYGHRGILTRLSSGNLVQAVADLDMSLELIRSSFSDTLISSLCYVYHLLKHRGFAKHLMGDDIGAKEDARTAQELQLRGLVHDQRHLCARIYWSLKLLQLPVNYLGFVFSF